MPIQLMTPFQWPCDLYFGLYAKNRFSNFVATKGIVFHKKILFACYVNPMVLGKNNLTLTIAVNFEPVETETVFCLA